MNILLSYPRSGSTWLRYCFEAITGIPTYGQNPDGTPGSNKFDQPMVAIPPFKGGAAGGGLTKRHELRHGHYNPDTDKLILLLRDYKECIPRHTGGNQLGDLIRSRDYFDNLQMFDQWADDRKWLIHL